MLPIIAIGLTDAATAAVERISGDRGTAHYATAEEALWDLPTDNNPTVAMATTDPTGERWNVHVIYGDDALGPLLTHTELDTRPVRVPCTGANLIITDSLGANQADSVRVVEGSAEDRAVTAAALEAVKLVNARGLLIVDQLAENPNWADAIMRMLDYAEERTEAVQAAPIDHPGADAAAELRRLEALRGQGQYRPAHFGDPR
jgi:hypothetical protein